MNRDDHEERGRHKEIVARQRATSSLEKGELDGDGGGGGLTAASRVALGGLSIWSCSHADGRTWMRMGERTLIERKKEAHGRSWVQGEEIEY